MNCLDCINPIYKFVEWLNTQVTTSTTDSQFLILLDNVLNNDDNAHPNGYTINKRTYPNYCCPDCPDTDCYGGTYFLGNVSQGVDFLTAYVIDKSKITNNCCTNIYGAEVIIMDPAVINVIVDSESYMCCNKFSSEYLNSLLRTLETYYDSENAAHVIVFPEAPYIEMLDNGIFEYSVFNGDSALGDILAAANTITNVSFRFLFLTYILTNGLVITCSECAESTNSILIMTNTLFTSTCLSQRPA